MKNTYSLFLILFAFFNYTNAQVGINTTTPTRMLDINGNARLRNTVHKNNDPNYDKALVTNENGEIEYWNKQDVIVEMKELTVETKKLYLSLKPDGNKIVSCGKVQLRFSSDTKPEIRLLTPPTTATSLYFTRISTKHESTKTLDPNISVSIPTTNTWSNLNTNYTLNIKDEYYLSYPGDSNLYRITFLARTMSSDSNSYTMLCEKF